MIVVDWSTPRFQMRAENGRQMVFDALRQCWLLLTPEEWVRQNFVQHLLQAKNYPPQLVALEKEITVNGLKKRFDLLVFDAAFQPWMLVECKAEKVQLSSAVLQQALRYNLSLPVPFLVITNGAQTRGWRNTGGGLFELNTLPDWGT